MKLNLLPTYVSKQGTNAVFLVLSLAILVLSIAGAVFMVLAGRSAVAQAIEASKAPEPNYQSALAYSAAADQVILQATDSDKHVKLAKAMGEHNTAYIKLYNTVFQYVPSFMRVRSISAVPTTDSTATVTLTGVITSYQQYADTVMSLLRIRGKSPKGPEGGAAAAPAAPAAPGLPGAPAAVPGAPAPVDEIRVMNVTRSGFTVNDMFVPSLNETDQIGTPIRPGEQNLPSDPQERQAAIIARAQAQPDPFAFQNANGFGSTERDRGAMPTMTEVTFTIQLSGVYLRTPVPRSTIMSAGAAGAAPAFGGAPTSFGPPTGFGGPAPAPAAAGPGRGAGAVGRDDE